MSIFVGMDCGGSSSRIMAVDAQGSVLYQGQSGAANLVNTPEARLRKHLTQACAGCPQPEYACGCFAGLVSDEIRQRGIDLMRELFPNAALRAEPDYMAAFYASPEGTDACVVAGTGSLICSRSGKNIVKSGGRGYLIGDEGSSFQFGRDALRYYLGAPSESSPRLCNAIRDLFGSDEEAKIVPAVYSTGTPASTIAKLARALGQDAAEGQDYAVKSVDRNFAELVDVFWRHHDRYLNGKTEKLGVSLVGGLWKAAPIFKDRFAELLKAQRPGADLIIHRIANPPLYGAVQLAREMLIGN